MPEFRDVIPGAQVSVSQPSLAGLQAAMAAGTLSSAALTGFYLQRIDRLNPALHAVITVNLDAPAEAAASDAARAKDGPRGPLEGIPVLVKDNVQVAGMPTTAGSPALLSGLAPEVRREYLTPLAERDPEAAARFEEKVVRDARRGYAVSEEELEKGVWAVSAPVLQGKRMIAVITVPSPLVRAPQPLQQKLIDQVRDAAQTLNEALRVTRR